MSYLALFATTFCLVAIRSFQQINVIHRHWLRVPPTSYAYAYGDLMTLYLGVDIITAGKSLPMAALFMGTGAWMGCYFSMWVQGRLG